MSWAVLDADGDRIVLAHPERGTVTVTADQARALIAAARRAGLRPDPAPDATPERRQLRPGRPAPRRRRAGRR